MVSLDVIEREIDERLQGDTTYANVERLAWLFTVKNNIQVSDTQSEQKPALTSTLSGSEFLEAASNVYYPSLMKILDEHMTALKIVQPKEYNAVMDRIRVL